MGQVIETLASHVAETRWDALPAAVQQHAKLVLLDTFGVILAGSAQPEMEKLRTQVAPGNGSGATVFSRDCPKADPHLAALLNGTAGRSIELCEGHRFVSCQAAVQVLPAVLAAAEAMQSSGREILTALILGYDVAVRLGAGTTQRALAHQNGQTAMIGAIAAGARLRGLDAAQISRALRIGATFILVPSYTNAVAGATALNAAGGMSGFAGTLAPEMALAGFHAQDDALEEALSRLVADGFDPRPVTEDLGTRWEITRSAFRLRACCSPIYAALDALEAALAELRPQPDEIERIDVATYRFASVMNSQKPINAFASKYSLPHAAAATILRGNAGFESFLDDVVVDPAIVAMRQRVHMKEDPALTASFPQQKPARVTLVLKDGRETTHKCQSPRGDFQSPYREDELRQKFRQLASRIVSAEGARALEQTIDRAESWHSMSELTSVFHRHRS